MIRFGSPERDYSLSKGGMTLEKGLRSQHSKDVQLHDSLGCAQFVNQNGLNSQLVIRLGASQRSNLNSKYLGGNIPILLFEFIVFNTRTTTRKLRRICCSGTKPELTLLERLVA